MLKKVSHENIYIPINEKILEGILAIPRETQRLVIFVHGSGSSRLSPRNRYVANVLENNNFATILFDLLTQEEDKIYENRFNIELLANRLVLATYWILDQPKLKHLSLGYFGASTGTAAALKAATKLEPAIKAIVSRGGRPDLAGISLTEIKTPTLLIVGGNDEIVIELNKKAQKEMRAMTQLTIIPEATHLFEEPGALEEVARLASNWFEQYLGDKK